jgi:hypothetical protein
MLQVPPLLPHLLPHTQTVVELVLLGEVKAQASGLAKKQAGGYVAEMMNNAKKGKLAVTVKLHHFTSITSPSLPSVPSVPSLPSLPSVHLFSCSSFQPVNL